MRRLRGQRGKTDREESEDRDAAIKPEGDRDKPDARKRRQLRERGDKILDLRERRQKAERQESNRDRAKSSLFDSSLRQAFSKDPGASGTFTGLL